MSEEARYVALMFEDDGNLRGRLYWYETEIALKAGDKVIAPVGAHDRLQCGTVERTLRGEPPYDENLIKRVAAKLHARRLPLSVPCRELGGMKYDEKHYTRFGAFVCAKSAQLSASDREILSAYGATETIVFGADTFVGDAAAFLTSECAKTALGKAARAKDCALIAGDLRAELFSAFLLLLAGVAEKTAAEDFLRAAGKGQENIWRDLSAFLREEGGAARFAATLGLSREAERISLKLRG